MQLKSVLPLAFVFVSALFSQANGQTASVTINSPSNGSSFGPTAPVVMSGFAGWSGYSNNPPTSVSAEILDPLGDPQLNDSIDVNGDGAPSGGETYEFDTWYLPWRSNGMSIACRIIVKLTGNDGICDEETIMIYSTASVS